VIELAAFLFMAWAVHTFECSFAAPTRLREHAGFRTIADEVRRFRAGAVALVQPRILAIQVLSFWQALAV
jgi:hypothetical protein